MLLGRKQSRTKSQERHCFLLFVVWLLASVVAASTFVLRLNLTPFRRLSRSNIWVPFPFPFPFFRFLEYLSLSLGVVDMTGYGCVIEAPPNHPGLMGLVLPWNDALTHRQIFLQFDVVQ